MKINRETLLQHLNAVKPGLAFKEVIEQSTYFVFMGGQVITFNDEIAVHAPLADGFEVSGAVPAKELLAILAKFSGDEVELEAGDNELKLRCGKSKAGIKLSAEITLPVDEIKIPESWTPLPKDFIDGLKACMPSVARDLTYPILTTVHITDDFAESTDNNKITRWDWGKGGDFGKEGLLLPIDAVTALVRFAPTDFDVDGGWAHFIDANDVVFSCRTSAGEYPDLTAHLDIEKIGELEFPAALAEMLDRAGVFLSGATSGDNLVGVEITDKGLMTVRGEGDYGWYEESCRTKWLGSDGVKFSVHPAHLQAIFSVSKDAEISVDRIKFTTSNFTHVVALEVK
jgi:DNA polymerase III sliding clamp (beta) subunit (PCNA family)